MNWSIHLVIEKTRDGKSSVWLNESERESKSERKKEMRSERYRENEWVRKSANQMARVEREHTAHTQFTYQPLIKMRNMCSNWLSWSALCACNRNANMNAIASQNETANNDGAKMDATMWIKVNNMQKGKMERMCKRMNERTVLSQSPPSSYT